MPLFDAYVMVDWSGGDRRRSGKQDCIWIAAGPRTAAEPRTESPPSRTEAEEKIRELLQPIADSQDGRALVCADFGYGYPAGFAELLPNPSGAAREPWRRVWTYLAEHLLDDLGTREGGAATNRSNRFDVANAINAAASIAECRGPFWCLFEAGSRACIPQRRPPQPFRGSIAPLRVTDRRAKSDTPFRLFGTGSVGSQVLTGIPRLERLRFDPRFARCSAVWPFETGWACRRAAWPGREVRILHAEIYPSVHEPLADSIRDRGQVRRMWHWARNLDSRDLLVDEFAIPPGIERGSPAEITIRSEEGWILGCPGCGVGEEHRNRGPAHAGLQNKVLPDHGL